MNKNNENLYQQQKLWAIHLGQLSCTTQHREFRANGFREDPTDPTATPSSAAISAAQLKESGNGGNPRSSCRVGDWRPSWPWQTKSRGFHNWGLQGKTQTRGFEQHLNYKHHSWNSLILPCLKLKNAIKHKAILQWKGHRRLFSKCPSSFLGFGWELFKSKTIPVKAPKEKKGFQKYNLP